MRSFDYDLETQEPLTIDGTSLKIEDVVAVARYRRRVQVSDIAKHLVRCCRTVVDVLLAEGEIVYGLTTGFGKLRDVVIPLEKTKALQENLIRSHACGVGEPFPEDVVRAAILLRANTLCRGNSGVRLETLERLLQMLNDDIFPYVPQKGSVGASGDLAPLSHLVLVLIGDAAGRFYPVARRGVGKPVITACDAQDFVGMPSPDALEVCAAREGWTFRPITLEAKEGLALNNGTQFTTAVACLLLYDVYFTLRFAELAAAMSLEAQRGVRGAYDPRMHAARRLPYQEEVARHVLEYCRGSQILDLYLNSAHLYRSRLHLRETKEHLEHVVVELARKGIACPASVRWLLTAIDELTERVGKLVPADAHGRVDAAKIEAWSQLPKRKQLEAFNSHLARARQDALSMLQTVEQVTFPKASTTPKVQSALVAVVEQLNKAVPDAPIVQDDYSFRCFPQVLGCAYRALWHVAEIVEIEINSATDNPLLFPPEPEGGFAHVSTAQYEAWLRGAPERLEQCRDSVIGGGNFHGQPIAVAMDYMCIAVAEVASIAERRIAHLVDDNHSRGLPSFLIDASGLNSGFMIPQYTAAALVSENKVLSHPASIDSIPTCANTEDHVSMSTFAARKAAAVVHHVRTVIAIEILAAYQGLKFREPLQPGVAIRRVVETLKAQGVERYDDDRVMYLDIHRVQQLMGEKPLLACLHPLPPPGMQTGSVEAAERAPSSARLVVHRAG
jgi:histidine ammonia-lyase